MSTVDALIAKALSTTSDEEAVAAFRMARKKNKGVTRTSTTSTSVDSQWKSKAQEYYNMAVKYNDAYKSMKSEKEFAYKEAFRQAEYAQKMLSENISLRSKIRKLERKIGFNMWRIWFFLQLTVVNVPLLLMLGF